MVWHGRVVERLRESGLFAERDTQHEARPTEGGDPRMRAQPAAHPVVAAGETPDDDADVPVTQSDNPITAEGCRASAQPSRKLL